MGIEWGLTGNKWERNTWDLENWDVTMIYVRIYGDMMGYELGK
jgi:hypothetical protein